MTKKRISELRSKQHESAPPWILRQLLDEIDLLQSENKAFMEINAATIRLLEEMKASGPT